jgi:hypothetical protein
VSEVRFLPGAPIKATAPDRPSTKGATAPPLLVDELDLVASSAARVFAVGNEVARHLARHAFPRPYTKVIHYSRLAARARAAGIVGHEDDLEQFRGSVSLEQVLATANEVLNALPASFRAETLARLSRKQLTESEQQLIFNYKLAFDGPT